MGYFFLEHGPLMKSLPPPDWMLPKGVAKTQWDYLTNESLAQCYDKKNRLSPLWQMDIDFFLRHCSIPGITIDLGCGTGRLGCFLEPKGFKIIGTDLSLPMLNLATQSKANHALYIHANMLEMPFLMGNSCDYAACLFSSFGMVLEKEHRLAMLDEVYRVLKPGGIFILHVHNFWSTWLSSGGKAWIVLELLKKWLGIGYFGNRKMPTHQGVAGLTLHLFTKNEAIGSLQTAGFKIKEALPLKVDSYIPHGYLIAALKNP